jgi:hypothetical protein
MIVNVTDVVVTNCCCTISSLWIVVVIVGVVGCTVNSMVPYIPAARSSSQYDTVSYYHTRGVLLLLGYHFWRVLLVLGAK